MKIKATIFIAFLGTPLLIYLFIFKPVDKKLTKCADDSTERINNKVEAGKIVKKDACEFIIRDNKTFQSCINQVQNESPMAANVILSVTGILNSSIVDSMNESADQCTEYLQRNSQNPEPLP